MMSYRWAGAGLLALGLAVVVLAGQAQAERNRHRQRHGRAAHSCQVPAVHNQAYRDACGACHMAYQPALLPAESWRKLLGGLKGHFGEQIDLKKEQAASIGKYLAANAADFCPAGPSRRIMRCLNGSAPLRITEVPYIVRKHRKLSQAVFRRDPVGSFSNCGACHRTAASGLYDDDFVRIPN